MKYYELSKEGDTLASLRFTRTMVSELLTDLSDGEPACALWLNITEISQVSFKVFLEWIIKLCIRNFNSSNNEILDYSLELFKVIYTSLKKN